MFLVKSKMLECISMFVSLIWLKNSVYCVQIFNINLSNPNFFCLQLKDDVGEVYCVEFAFLVVAGGPYSADIARLLQIGSGPGPLSVPLPVEPR